MPPPAPSPAGSPTRSPQLPPPDAEAAAHSARLVEHLRALVAEAGGWLPFDRYMEEALYAPGLGYYAAGATKFGAAGDFITAPELHPVFARTLAAQVAQILSLSAPELIEFGAGTGRLAAELLLALEAREALPRRYAIVELSAPLKARQQATIAAAAPHLVDRVQWLDRLPVRIEGCIVGNEVLDAMPVKLFRLHEGGVDERGLAVVDDALVWRERPAPAELADYARRVLPPEADDYVSEAPFALRAFVRTVAGRLARGAALFLDYGFPRAEYYHPQRDRGTVIAHYRHHAIDDPLFLPGLADITAHVDFTAVAESAAEAGLDCLGYTSQARFLMNCGIVDAMATWSPGTPDYYRAAGAVQTLVSEAEMGELFKVMALGRGVEDALLGFAAGDRRHRL